jgi:adenosylcobalamin-dependent ribonucleoside-triphosphate reductase
MVETENEIKDITTKETITPWGEIGYITYKRTYSRRLNENNQEGATEEFKDTIERAIDACRTQLKVGFTEQEEAELSDILLGLKGIVAGRFLWQLGTKTVKKLGLLSLQNCAFVTINEPVEPFTWAMDCLMLGSGVGFNIQKENVYQLPKLKSKIKIERIDTDDADYIVPDSREGWVKLLGKVLKAHFHSGQGFSYSTILIRGKGAPIKGFGGTASGPEDLCEGIQNIHKILNSRSSKKLRPVDCLDIMNIIGGIVVAGNVRRSAQIALGDPDDIEFLKAKRWDLGVIPNWRKNSNNSVICSDASKLPREFWKTYEQGEPYGIINMELSRKIGRLGETEYPDPDVDGYNPCAEQSLCNKETCALGEVFLPNLKNKKEFFKTIYYLYRIIKHSLALPCHHKDTQDIVNKNMRMGIGITGTLQATDEQRSWLDDGYKYLRELDKEYSKLKNFPESIKLTTSKPSGTLSLLAGTTPGIHPSPAGPYYIRRIRIAAGSHLLEVCKKHGYGIEYQRNFDGSDDKGTFVVSFPCKVPEGTPIAEEFTALKQLEWVQWMQKNWSDNAVSCTIYYKKNEIPIIKKWLDENLTEGIKTVSFLLYQGHGFDQAPYETITKEKYDELKQGTKKIESVEIKEEDFQIEECSSGACPIK